VDNLGIRTCEHRTKMQGQWVRNDGQVAPVFVVIGGYDFPTFFTLTNQAIYAKCSKCFELARAAATPLVTKCSLAD
jgi:hypothetical protein